MAPPPSSPGRGRARSTRSLAGRSRPSGGSSRSYANTGRRFSTARCCASCSTTSAATSGSWRGSMTERLRTGAGFRDGCSEAAVGGISGSVGDLLQPTGIRIEVDAHRGAKPDSVAVTDNATDVSGPAVRRSLVNRLLGIGVDELDQLQGVLVDEGKNDGVMLCVDADDPDQVARTKEPGRIGAIGEVKAFDLVCARGGKSEERRVGKECRSRWSPYH